MKKILCGLALCIGTSLFAQSNENIATAFTENISVTAANKTVPPAKKNKITAKPAKVGVKTSTASVSAERVAAQRARFKEMLESVIQTKIKSSLTEAKDEKTVTEVGAVTAMKEPPIQ